MTRIMTYNVHLCIGTDRRLDIDRVADVIAAQAPDIIALQELDVGRARTGGLDQAQELARRLGMRFHFNAALTVENEAYGDAILTHLPERLVKAGPLPGYPRLRGLEPRGALWVAVEVDGHDLQVITTHLGLVPPEQRRQAAALAGINWLGAPDRQNPTIFLGDFNAHRGSRICQTLLQGLKDARAQAGGVPTFPSTLPIVGIDHVLVSDDVIVRSLNTPLDRRSRQASDHLPLVLDFEIA
jgi:endonuclease/exonuclease/phosphatase family metal-dependent hydrolase